MRNSKILFAGVFMNRIY